MTPLPPDDQGLLLRAIKSEYMCAIVGIRNWFLNPADAAEKLEAWRRNCYEQRPPRHDREQSPGCAHEIGTRSQPVLLITAGQL